MIRLPIFAYEHVNLLYNTYKGVVTNFCSGNCLPKLWETPSWPQILTFIIIIITITILNLFSLHKHRMIDL